MIVNKLRVLVRFTDGERWWWGFDDLKRKIISRSWSILDVSCYDLIFYASTNQIGGALLILMKEKCSKTPHIWIPSEKGWYHLDPIKRSCKFCQSFDLKWYHTVANFLSQCILKSLQLPGQNLLNKVKVFQFQEGF